MQHEAWFAQLTLILLVAAFLVAIRRQVFVPIADSEASRGPPVRPSCDDDEEDEEELLLLQPARVHRSRGFLRLGFLPLAVLLTAALRVVFLVALHR